MNRRIALLGSSLAIDSIAAALDNARDFELLRNRAALGECNPWLDQVVPEVVIFDLAAIAARNVIEALRSRNLLLIGMDFAEQRMIVISGEQTRLATTEDLLGVLYPCRRAGLGGRT